MSVDRLLSIYGQPVQSWPGEEDVDAEARANFEAMNPHLAQAKAPKLRPDEAYRGTFLPFRETLDGRHEWAVPGFLMDVADSARAIKDTSGLGLGPMPRPSQYSPEVFEQILGHGMAGALTGITGNIPRLLTKPPPGTTELGIFGGRSAKTANQEMLAKAEQMAAEGAPREEIWRATGWFQGPDKKWRFEIDDSKAMNRGYAYEKFHNEYQSPSGHGLMPDARRKASQIADGLRQKIQSGEMTKPQAEAEWQRLRAPHQAVLDEGKRLEGVAERLRDQGALSETFYHPDAYAAYPELKGIRTNMRDDNLVTSVGEFVPGNTLSSSKINLASDASNPQRRSTTLHEVQHGIQSLEGFSDGTSPQAVRASGVTDPKEILDAYLRNAGETEARAVQARRDLTPEERLARPPWMDYDVPESQQIVRFGNEGGMASAGDDYVRMYHGTTDEGKAGIEADGLVRGPAFFSDRQGQAGSFGGHVFEVPVRKSDLMIDADLPGGRLLTVEEANRYWDNEGWTVDDYLNAGRYSFGVDKDVPLSSSPQIMASMDMPAGSGGLDMSPEARLARAREMGFDLDTTWYHGTTHNIDEFRPGKANPEGYLGKSIYMTSEPADASKNYAGLGDDLTNRIEQKAEQIMQAKGWDKHRWGTPEYNAAHERATEMAKKKLVGPHDGAVLPVVTRNDKILDLTENGTLLDFSPKYDVKGEFIADSPLILKMMNSLERQAKKYDGLDVERILGDIADHTYDTVLARDLDNALRDSEGLMFATDNAGRPVANEVLRQLYQDMGFRGVDIDASATFRKMDMPRGTRHRMMFKAKDTRSPNAEFDPAKKNSGKLLASHRVPLPVASEDEHKTERPAALALRRLARKSARTPQSVDEALDR